MKKMLLLLLSSLSIIISSNSEAQTQTNTASAKATATLAANCTIATQNVNFGQISLPVSTQSANANMTVQCSKSAPYTIGLTYGGIYGAGISGNYWKVVSSSGCVSNTNPASLSYNPLNPNGTPGTYSWLEYNTSGQVLTGTCTTSPPGAGTYVASLGYTASTSSGLYYNPSNSTVYTYGKMIGAASGDSIAYSIQVPNSPNQVWNTSNYNYSTSGTGAIQTIPVIVTLVPSQTTNRYPTVDTYLDTVTATIAY